MTKFTLKKQEVILLSGVIVILGLIIRLFHITSQGLWYDELQSVTHAHLQVHDLLKSVYSLDPHPPFYYLQLHAWMAGGTSDFWIRLNSTLWSVLGLISLLITSHKVYGKTVALLAGIFFAFSPMAVFYAQETRMYAWMMFLGVWVWFFTVDYFSHGFHWITAAGILISTLAFLYSQGAAFVILAAPCGYALLSFISDKSKWKFFLGWAGLQLLILILYIPWILRARTISVGHAVAPTFHDIIDTLSILLLGIFNPRPIWFSILALGFLILLSYALLPKKEGRTFFLSFVVAPLLACGIISYLYRPIWFYRTLSFLVPFFCLSFALALSELLGSTREGSKLKRDLAIVCVVLAVGISSLFLGYQQSSPRRIWTPREAVKFVNLKAKADDVIMIASPRLFWGWNWYASGPGSVNPLTTDYSLVSKQGNLTLFNQDMQPFLEGGKTVWLVYLDIDSEPTLPDIPGLKREVVYDAGRMFVKKVLLETVPQPSN